MAGRWRANAERLAAKWLEVPGDTLENVPRVSIVGNRQVVVENYRQIMEFSASVIRVASSEGQVVIRGEELRVRTIVPGELVAEGMIAGVDLR